MDKISSTGKLGISEEGRWRTTAAVDGVGRARRLGFRRSVTELGHGGGRLGSSIFFCLSERGNLNFELEGKGNQRVAEVLGADGDEG